MIEVRVKRNESIERAISRFKKKVKEDGFLFTLKERQYYTKPSEERREKKNRAKRRNFYNRLRDEKSFWEGTFFLICIYLYKTKYTIVHSYFL